MKVALRILLIGMLSLLVIGLPVLPEGALQALQVDQQQISLAFAEDGGGAWISAPIEGEHTIAGLTWDDPEDAPAQAEVRIRVDGDWGDWEVVETDDEHTPDPASREDDAARGGTAPIVIEGADAVQFRVNDAGPPRDLTADLVDVEDPDAAKRLRDQPGAADASPDRPAIHPRSDWGGESCPGPNRDPIEYVDRVEVLFVHHTAGHTSYARSEVPSIIRAICSYHVNSRGWDDIGYNALVDRYGGIWVGRDGGIDEGVQGAHTGGFNGYSTGVALIGHHDQNGGTPVTGAALDGLARYAAWKLDVHNVDPLGTTVLTSNGSSKYRDGVDHRFDNISGHRDASSTACPGSYCYAGLGQLRTDVDDLGGFRIFGGWPQKHTMELRSDGTWETPRFTFRFSEPDDEPASASTSEPSEESTDEPSEESTDEPVKWTFEVRDADGAVLLEDAGTTSGPVSIDWDARVNGKPAPQGLYTSHVTARRVSDGATARPASHEFRLGGELGDFADVPSSNTFHDDIEWLAQQRITLGCNPPANTRFCPGDPVTRGQMAAFLVRALKLPAAPEAGFRDVPSSHVFKDDIDRLAAADITRGCNPPHNDRFCPGDPVSRDQMAAFLVRAHELTAMDHPGFRDVPSNSTFAEDIRRLATADVTRGCNPPDNTMYCPTDPVTREQMAAFLRRASTS